MRTNCTSNNKKRLFLQIENTIWKMFSYNEHINDIFLLGTYRSDKDQLSWILGKKPKRYKILYNVRYNESLFDNRQGGVSLNSQPSFVLLYDHKDLNKETHLFACKSMYKSTADEMIKMGYPNPQGSYIIFELSEELMSYNINILTLIEDYKKTHKEYIKAEPIITTGSLIDQYKTEAVVSQTLTNNKKKKVIKFIDLFAGIGGIRCGLEQAIEESGYIPDCVFTSEIKPHAIKVLNDNHPGEKVYGDITKINSSEIPDFDILCAGFPCQAFSSAGKRQGFADTRGTLFFEVERILKEKKPQGFILENVEGLVNHDNGNTLRTIVERLKSLNYNFDFRVLNSKYFGVPQERKRIYIVGSINGKPDLNNFTVNEKLLNDILETGLQTENTPFIQNLLANYKPEKLYGMSIKDKRGGNSNIHSWDLGIKGSVSDKEKQLLNALLSERRKKHWAEQIGIDWMDGMPLTTQQIKTFFDTPDLQKMLDHLSNMGYIKYEHPKKLVRIIKENGAVATSRVSDESKPKGYNIVAGKLSFPISKILSPQDVAPTLVAMDMQKLYVVDNGGLRRLSLREGLRLFGYPDDFSFNVNENDGFDLLGNTVVVPVIKAVANRLLQNIKIK